MRFFKKKDKIIKPDTFTREKLMISRKELHKLVIKELRDNQIGKDALVVNVNDLHTDANPESIREGLGLPPLTVIIHTPENIEYRMFTPENPPPDIKVFSDGILKAKKDMESGTTS